MSFAARRRCLIALVALAALPLLAGCGRRKVRGRPLASGAVVLALGDSLTHGTGADAATAYPSVLARLTGWTVVNGGVPGDTAAQAFERLPPLLEEHRPALVLVCVGGNDILRRADPAQMRAHTRRICERAAAAGAQVVLIAVPSLGGVVFGRLGDHPMYAELADELKLPLHANGWSSVLSDASLRADAVHANAAGYERFAHGLLQTLRESALLPG